MLCSLLINLLRCSRREALYHSDGSNDRDLVTLYFVVILLRRVIEQWKHRAQGVTSRDMLVASQYRVVYSGVV